jgi:hypothetical protein
MPLHVPGLPLPETVGTAGDVLAITTPSPLVTEWLSTQSAVLSGMNAQPWAPGSVRESFWALANFQATYNTTLLAPLLTANSTTQNMRTRISLGNQSGAAAAFRLRFNVTSVTNDGWCRVSALLTDNIGSAALTGTNAQIFFTQNTEDPLGEYHFEWQVAPPHAGASYYFELRLDVANNATSGVLSIDDVSLEKVSHVVRPLYFGQSYLVNYVQIVTQVFDAPTNKWRCHITTIGPDGDLDYALSSLSAHTSPLTWVSNPADALWAASTLSTTVSVGSTQPLTSPPAGEDERTIRQQNNDQILEVRMLDGTTYTYQGNVHNGETMVGTPTFEWADVDGNWSTWDGTGKRWHSAVRFRATTPTKFTRPAPDNDDWATVSKVMTFFPDGMMRMDRTTTFTQSVVLRDVFEWMASYDEDAGKLGRLGRGLIVTDEVDTFLRLDPPATPGSSTSTTGGTLPAATYTYAVTALTEGGETLPSTVKTQVTTGATSTVDVTWSTVTNATGYRIYGRTGGRLVLLATVGAGATSWTDDYSVPAFGPPPPRVNTARRYDTGDLGVDGALSGDAYWSVFYDPIIGVCHGHIYDRDAVLERAGVGSAWNGLLRGSSIHKNYLQAWGEGEPTIAVSSGTEWSATHWSYAYWPQDPVNYHLEVALKASELAALRSAYPAA